MVKFRRKKGKFNEKQNLIGVNGTHNNNTMLVCKQLAPCLLNSKIRELANGNYVLFDI